MIVLLAIYSYICWRSVERGLLILLGALPLYLIKLEIFSIPTTFLELIFGVAFVIWLIKYARSFNVSIPQSRLISIATSMIVLGALLSLTQTSNLMSSINAIKSFLIEPILLAIMIISVFGEKKIDLKSWLLPLTTTMATLSLYAIFQYFTGFGIPDAWFLERRVTSVFPYPNALGHFIAPIITMNTVWLMQRGLKRLGTFEIALISSTMLGTIALILSETEAAWIAILATVVLAGIYIGTQRKLWISITILGIILGIALPQARHKILLQDWSGQTRLAQWEETTHFLKDSPEAFLIGAGANNYPSAVAPFHTHDYLEIFQQPHNIILNVWVEYGLLGLLGVLVLGLTLAHRVFTTPSASSSTMLPLTAALLEMSIHGLVDVPYFKNDLSMLTWSLIALLYISSYSKHRRQ